MEIYYLSPHYSKFLEMINNGINYVKYVGDPRTSIDQYFDNNTEQDKIKRGKDNTIQIKIDYNAGINQTDINIFYNKLKGQYGGKTLHGYRYIRYKLKR